MNLQEGSKLKLLEVIVTSAEEARTAEESGAHRLELVREMDKGGLTPSLQTVEQVVRSVSIPVRVMLRHNPTFEIADENELRVLERQAEQLAELPIKGLVLGFLRGGTVDQAAMQNLLAAAATKQITFHRAIECVHHLPATIQCLKTYPMVNRILASGGSGAPTERIQNLEQLQCKVGPEITVLAGGGISERVLAYLAQSPILSEFHTGRAVRDSQGKLESAKVARLRRILDNSINHTDEGDGR